MADAKPDSVNNEQREEGEQREERRLETRGFFQTLYGPMHVKSDATRRRKLGNLVGWMASQRLEVEAAISMLISRDPAVRRRGTKHVLERHGRMASADDSLDEDTAIMLALAVCERETHPVTARTVSAVEDPLYVGYQRRRTLSARLWALTLVFLGLAVFVDFSISWVHFNLAPRGPITETALSTLRYPPWTALVANAVLRPTSLFFWGLVGAGLYLLRRLYQFTERRLFDHRLVEMYAVRMMMGGIAGLLLATVIMGMESVPDATKSREAWSLEDPARVILGSAIAVLGGFSVRVFYAVLERFAELVRMQFGSTSSGDKPAKEPDSRRQPP